MKILISSSSVGKFSLHAVQYHTNLNAQCKWWKNHQFRYSFSIELIGIRQHVLEAVKYIQEREHSSYRTYCMSMCMLCAVFIAIKYMYIERVGHTQISNENTTFLILRPIECFDRPTLYQDLICCFARPRYLMLLCEMKVVCLQAYFISDDRPKISSICVEL